MEEQKPSPTKEQNITYRGIKAMPFILGNETFEKLGTFGTSKNLMVYLVTVFNMKRVSAAVLINIFNGTGFLTPVIGAFLADTFFGRYKTLGFASIASCMGMLLIMLTAAITKLHPPQCETTETKICPGPTASQLGFLFCCFGFLVVGSGGIRPCAFAFGADQFNPKTESGKKGIDSYANWYYFVLSFAMVVSYTFIIYVQSNVSWALGFAVPAILMILASILFFAGSRIYVKIKPEGSPFISITQVMVAAFKKRKLKLPNDPQFSLYNHILTSSLNSKLPYSYQFRFLDKAAIQTMEDKINADGSSTDHWRLCTLQQVEEVKCIVRVIPIWVSTVMFNITIFSQNTYVVFQAIQSNRHLGPNNFEVPAASYIAISWLSMAMWLPIYDRALVPLLKRITHRQTGLTLLQRIGVGIILSVIAIFVSASFEQKRRNIAHEKPTLGISHGGGAISSMSALWFIPQLGLIGMAEAFCTTGQVEFFYKQFPENMRSIGGSFFFLSLAAGSYLNGFMVSIVHETTKRTATKNWLPQDLNKGRLDYYYYLIGSMGVLNFMYFLVCGWWYRYKDNSGDAFQVGMEMEEQKNTLV